MEPDTFVPFSSFYIPKNQYKAARRHFVPFRRPQLRAASAATRAAARCATDASWLRTASRRAETPVHRTIWGWLEAEPPLNLPHPCYRASEKMAQKSAKKSL